MSGIGTMMVVWGVLTSVLIGLMIYRGILGNHEEDQLFLDRAEAALEQQQVDVVRRINRIDPVIRWVGVASGGLLLLIGGWWLYRGLFIPPVIE